MWFLIRFFYPLPVSHSRVDSIKHDETSILTTHNQILEHLWINLCCKNDLIWKQICFFLNARPWSESFHQTIPLWCKQDIRMGIFSFSLQRDLLCQLKVSRLADSMFYGLHKHIKPVRVRLWSFQLIVKRSPS